MRLEDRGVFVAHRAAHLLLELDELVARLLQRFHEPIDLGSDIFFPDGNAEYRRLAALDDDSAADRDSRRDAVTLVRADVPARGGGGAAGAVG